MALANALNLDSTSPLSLPLGGTGVSIAGPTSGTPGPTTYLDGTGGWSVPAGGGGGGFTSYTPALNFSGLTTGITYAVTPTGYFIQIGNLVYFTASLQLSSKGSATGFAAISLPTTSETIAVPFMVIYPVLGFVNYVTGIPIGLVGPTTASFSLYTQLTNADIAGITNVMFANNSSVNVSGCYISS